MHTATVRDNSNPLDLTSGRCSVEDRRDSWRVDEKVCVTRRLCCAPQGKGRKHTHEKKGERKKKEGTKGREDIARPATDDRSSHRIGCQLSASASPQTRRPHRSTLYPMALLLRPWTLWAGVATPCWQLAAGLSWALQEQNPVSWVCYSP